MKSIAAVCLQARSADELRDSESGQKQPMIALYRIFSDEDDDSVQNFCMEVSHRAL